MTDAVTPTAPTADNPTLRKLRAELGNDAAVDHFVTDFLALLDERLSALQGLLQQRRLEDSVTALLTIETTGTMIGADDLAAAATRLRALVSDRPGAAYGPHLAAVVDAAERARRELTPDRS